VVPVRKRRQRLPFPAHRSPSARSHWVTLRSILLPAVGVSPRTLGGVPGWRRFTPVVGSMTFDQSSLLLADVAIVIARSGAAGDATIDGARPGPQSLDYLHDTIGSSRPAPGWPEARRRSRLTRTAGVRAVERLQPVVEAVPEAGRQRLGHHQLANLFKDDLRRHQRSKSPRRASGAFHRRCR
jgi:hypothetical protein